MIFPTVRRTMADEVGVVFRQELRRFLRAPRTLWAAGLYALAGLGTASLLRRTAEVVGDEAKQADVDPQQLASQSGELLGQVLSFTGWGDAATGRAIADAGVPLTVLAFFVLGSWFLPMLVATVAFDRYSDLATGGARFALLRVRRESWFAGRWLATAASSALLLGVMWLLALVPLARIEGASPQAVLREGVRDALLSMLLALPYLSLTALVSSLARPAVAFVATAGTWLALSTLGASLPTEGAGAALRGLLPWSWAPHLIARDAGQLSAGIAGLSGLALLYALAALWLLRRRDV